MKQELERREVWYSGRVQGVGFRATALAMAAGFDVTGFVSNRDDGRVELVVEGELGEIERFLAAVWAAKQRNISDVQIIRGVARGEFQGFTIR